MQLQCKQPVLRVLINIGEILKIATGKLEFRVTLDGAFIRISFPSLALLTLAALVLSGCASNTNTLTDAAAAGNANLVETMIKGGAKVNEIPQGKRYTALCYLITFSSSAPLSNNQKKTLDILVKNGANPNAYCSGMLPLLPLHIAVMSRNKELVKFLLKGGAKVNLQANENGVTALMKASDIGDVEMVNYLVAQGASKTAKDNEGKTAHDHYTNYLASKRELDRQEEAAYAQQQRDKEETRAFWKGAATIATGVAVGNATRNLDSGQQTRMMKSSMEAVDSGDTSGLNETSRQVRGEQAQSHQAKMREIEAEKERQRAATAKRESGRSATSRNAQSNRTNNTDAGSASPRTSPQPRLNYSERKQNYRCEFEGKFYGNSSVSEDKARADALYFYNKDHREGGYGNIKKIGNAEVKCKFENGYKCIAVATYEQDSPSPCGSRTQPSKGSAK